MDHSPRFLKLCDEIRANVKEVTTDEIAARLAKGDPFALVDVREESEFAAGRIKGARHLGKGVIERDIEKAYPDTSTEIVLYCGGGFRSAIAAETLGRMGYTNVSSMAGGIREWKGKSLPLES
ncbi:Rhodanese domain protein [Labilithrix luteola]|uniref:Rhodanese domain protein n=1 Tax=Labilithrix luteola TaxID=1391654 RepID=A0A0K1QED3_9BACT|nr:rhodanese-like domain-containing protein [Labilithrix luteola]AKV04126.1 Rhodanese domain protein [Labilithrix luteola]